MMSKHEIDRFKEIYRRKFGAELSDREVIENGGKLLDLIKLIIRPALDKEVNTKHLIRYGKHEN